MYLNDFNKVKRSTSILMLYVIYINIMNAKPAILMYVKPFYGRGEASALDTNITSQRLIETPVANNWKVICHVLRIKICIYFPDLSMRSWKCSNSDDFCSCCFLCCTPDILERLSSSSFLTFIFLLYGNIRGQNARGWVEG